MKLSKINVLSLTALSLSSAVVLGAFAPAYAQGAVNSKATEKATWHVAPREIQIIDDRPIIRDFREAPSMPQQIQLPPAPQGFGGPGGGGGGNLAGGPGSTLPAGGMPLGSGPQGYRTPSDPMGALPKSGFGGPSNIPARGFAPKGLANGSSNNQLAGKMLNQNKPSGAGAGPSRGMASNPGRTNGDYHGPAAATYSGGYGNGSGAGYGGSASRTDTMVRGSLLRK